MERLIVHARREALNQESAGTTWIKIGGVGGVVEVGGGVPPSRVVTSRSSQNFSPLPEDQTPKVPAVGRPLEESKHSAWVEVGGVSPCRQIMARI